MKILWLIFTLIPAPFLFHFYEYGQHIKREEPSFLFLGTVFYIVITGALARQIKIRYIVLVNVITGAASLILAMYFISNDGGWFKPFGRDVVIVLTAIVFFIGQLFIRLDSNLKSILKDIS